MVRNARMPHTSASGTLSSSSATTSMTATIRPNTELTTQYRRTPAMKSAIECQMRGW